MTTLKLSPGTFRQSTFDKVGTGLQYDIIYLTKGNYIVNTPLKLNSGIKITGDAPIYDESGNVTDPGAVINLAPKMSTKIFPAGTPIFGQTDSSISDVIFENITFDGHAKEQIVSHGKSFHIFAMFKNGSNLDAHNIIIKNSQGDGIRAINFKHVQYYNNKVYGCGHDGFYAENCTDVKGYNNITYLRSNSALRCRDSNDVFFYGNKIYRTNDYSPAYCPGIQAQVDKSSSNVNIYENEIYDTLGVAIWAAGIKSTNSSAGNGITIKNNLVVRCGQMPAGITTVSNTGGIFVDGWNNAVVEDNNADQCLGNGIRVGPYIGSSQGTGYKITISGNIVTNTIKGNYAKDGSNGAGIANMVPKKCTVVCENNNVFNNVINYVNISGKGISVDPLYVGSNDYHLKPSSPCIFKDFELGRYNGTTEATKWSGITNADPTKLIGDAKAVIIMCQDENSAVDLSNAIKDADLLDDEQMVIYIPDGKN